MKVQVFNRKIISITSEDIPLEFEYRIIPSGIANELLIIYEDCTEDLSIRRISRHQAIVEWELTEEQLNLLER